MTASNKKILIIEDDRFLRELIARKLSAQGYEILEAVDGEKGLESIKEENPDIVLLDLILPGIDGFEVLSRVGKDEDLAEIPILVLSNLGQKEDVEKALNLGAVDYLVKAHFTPEEIIQKISQTIR